MWVVQIKFWSPVVLHHLYWKWGNFKRRTKNNNKSSETLGTILHKGCTLCMYNYHNSPGLAKFLKSHNTNCMGNIKINKQQMPKTMKETKLQKSKFIGQHCSPVCVVPCSNRTHDLTWHDVTWHDNLNLPYSWDHEAINNVKEKSKFVCVWFIIINIWVMLEKKITHCRCT